VVRGYWYPTDPDWFRFLRGQGPLDEVNFWRPHARAFRALPAGVGAPLLFKLRGRAVVGGFGYFERYEELTILEAWDAFEFLNGASDLETFGRLIAVNRRLSAQESPWGLRIGCIMLSTPVFFSDAACVQVAADWGVQGAQAGGSFDLAVGEGRRVWEECRVRAAADEARRLEARGRVAEAARRAGTVYEQESRPGQRIFKAALLAVYGGACAVTNEHSLPVLDAAHIRPYAREGPDRVSNGLLLRADLHRLFDSGYVTVTPRHEFRVSRALKAQWQNGRAYYELEHALDGKPIRLPRRRDDWPAEDALAWHER
jgi:putative restriction endonuclease